MTKITFSNRLCMKKIFSDIDRATIDVELKHIAKRDI